jgi:hypothetical protein
MTTFLPVIELTVMQVTQADEGVWAGLYSGATAK